MGPEGSSGFGGNYTVPLLTAGVGLLLVANPGLGIAVINAAGFSSAGPVAGSFAAGVQSSYGIVQAGGTFATLQSAAMGGYGVATVTTATQGFGCAIFAAGASWNGWWNNEAGDENEDGNEKEKKGLSLSTSN